MLVDNISVILCTDFYSRILRSSLRTYAPDIGMILYYSLILHPQYRFDSKVSHPSTLSRLSVFVQYMQHIQTMENSLNTGESRSSTRSLINIRTHTTPREAGCRWLDITLVAALFLFFIFFLLWHRVLDVIWPGQWRLVDRIPVLYELVSVGRHMVGLAFPWLCISYASNLG